MTTAADLKRAVSLVGSEPRIETAIVVNGTPYDIGLPVTHWWDPGGFDGYATDRVTVREQDRKTGSIHERVLRGDRFSRRKLTGITQFMMHHSGGDGPTPDTMYRTLWLDRGLSVHFACEDDGRVWQFLDVKECAWHAGRHNGCSVGVEAALFPLVDADPHYYAPDACKRRNNQPHSQRTEVLQGRPMRVYVMPTRQIYALARLVAGTWAALRHETRLPQFEAPPSFPHQSGAIPMSVIDRPLEHVGLIGHLHATAAKIDPAGFPWVEFERSVADIFAQLAV